MPLRIPDTLLRALQQCWTMSDEVAKSQPPAKNGFPDFLSLAAMMAGDEDVTIFSRFDELNIFNLLVLQEEIHVLSKSFQTMCQPRHNDSEETPQGCLASYILGSR